MLPLEQPDRIHVVFDDHRLVANAGLLLPVTLARHLGLGELVDRHIDLGRAPGRANAGDKVLTLVASALAGGDCIDVSLSGGGSGGAYAIQRLVDQPFRPTFGNVRLSDLGKARIQRYVNREPMADTPDIFGLNLSRSWLYDWARTDATEAIRVDSGRGQDRTLR